jgi:hypothetical protein
MKNLCLPEIDKYRLAHADKVYGTKDEERALGGAFLVPHRDGRGWKVELMVIASAGSDQPQGWRFDHVSVSTPARTPTWEEMDFVKRLFFHPEEVAYQLHVSPVEHINNHPYCLHLWRNCEQAIPLPPAAMVGYRDSDFGGLPRVAEPGNIRRHGQ